MRKHLQDPALTEIASGNDFSVTTTERKGHGVADQLSEKLVKACEAPPFTSFFFFFFCLTSFTRNRMESEANR